MRQRRRHNNLLAVTDDANVSIAIHKLMYVCCTPIVRRMYVSYRHRLLKVASCHLIKSYVKPTIGTSNARLSLRWTCNHFDTFSSPHDQPREPGLVTPVAHARSPNSHNLLWLRLKGCNIYVILLSFSTIFVCYITPLSVYHRFPWRRNWYAMFKFNARV